MNLALALASSSSIAASSAGASSAGASSTAASSSAGGSSLGAGSSAVGGSIASYQAQTTANLVSENMVQGAGSAVSNLNQNIANLTTDYYRAGGRADMFAGIGQFGKDLSEKESWIGSAGRSIFQTFKTA